MLILVNKIKYDKHDKFVAKAKQNQRFLNWDKTAALKRKESHRLLPVIDFIKRVKNKFCYKNVSA